MYTMHASGVSSEERVKRMKQQMFIARQIHKKTHRTVSAIRSEISGREKTTSKQTRDSGK